MHTVWMKGDCGHGMHMRLCDILDDDRDIIVPCANGLVVGCGDETSVLVDERDTVHRPKMLVIFLGNLTRVHVVLDILSAPKIAPVYCSPTHLDDLLIAHTSKEDVLLVFIGVELDDIWYFTI